MALLLRCIRPEQDHMASSNMTMPLVLFGSMNNGARRPLQTGPAQIGVAAVDLARLLALDARGRAAIDRIAPAGRNATFAQGAAWQFGAAARGQARPDCVSSRALLDGQGISSAPGNLRRPFDRGAWGGCRGGQGPRELLPACRLLSRSCFAPWRLSSQPR